MSSDVIGRVRVLMVVNRGIVMLCFFVCIKVIVLELLVVGKIVSDVE